MLPSLTNLQPLLQVDHIIRKNSVRRFRSDQDVIKKVSVYMFINENSNFESAEKIITCETEESINEMMSNKFPAIRLEFCENSESESIELINVVKKV